MPAAGESVPESPEHPANPLTNGGDPPVGQVDVGDAEKKLFALTPNTWMFSVVVTLVPLSARPEFPRDVGVVHLGMEFVVPLPVMPPPEPLGPQDVPEEFVHVSSPVLELNC